jgi:hypothetical protein
MTRKAEKVTTIRQELGPDDLSDEDRRSDEEQQDIDEFFGDVGPAGKSFKLYRLNVETGKFGYCEVGPRDLWSEEYVKRKWGGGKFQVRLKGEHNEPLGSRVFEIDGPPVSPRGPATSGDGGEGFGLTKLLLDSAEKRADDFKAMMLTVLQAAFGQQRGSDPLEVVKLAREIASVGTAPSGVPPEKYITDRAQSYDAGFEKGVDIGTREGRRGDADPGWPGVVRELALPALEAIKSAAPALAPAPPQPARLGPVPMPPAPVPPVQELHTVNEPVWFAKLKKWLPMVGFAASNNMEPAKAAGMVMDQVSEDDYDAFVEDVLGPDFVARITPLLPPALVQRYPQWTSQTLEAIRSAVEEEQAPSPSDGVQAGDEPPGDEPEEPGNG